jgi:hypothetical protein
MTSISCGLRNPAGGAAWRWCRVGKAAATLRSVRTRALYRSASLILSSQLFWDRLTRPKRKKGLLRSRENGSADLL